MTDPGALVAFLRSVEPLKHTLRQSWTSTGRPESVAEHTWRLCLLALVLADDLPDVDIGRLIAILLVHDLGEAVRGDIPAPDQSGDKSAEERADLVSLLAPLPPAIADRLLALWDEYDQAETREARLAKSLDKIETCLQHVEGINPPGFDFGFNLSYGRQWIGVHPLVDALREIVDSETARKVGGNT